MDHCALADEGLSLLACHVNATRTFPRHCIIAGTPPDECAVGSTRNGHSDRHRFVRGGLGADGVVATTARHARPNLVVRASGAHLHAGGMAGCGSIRPLVLVGRCGCCCSRARCLRGGDRCRRVTSVGRTGRQLLDKQAATDDSRSLKSSNQPSVGQRRTLDLVFMRPTLGTHLRL